MVDRIERTGDRLLAGRYRLLELLGTGESGSTYRGIDLERQQPVMVKILSLQRASDSNAIEFQQEVSALARLHHHSIPQYLDYFETAIAGEHSFCIVQPLASSRTLHDWQEDRHLFARANDVRQSRHSLVDRRMTIDGLRPQQLLSRASDDGLSFRVSIPAVGLNSKVSQRSLLNILVPIGSILAFEWGLYETAMPTDNNYESLWFLAILFGLILLPVLLILTIRLGVYLRAIFIRYEITLDRIHLKIERFLGERRILNQLLFVSSIEAIEVNRSAKQGICITLADSTRWYEVKPFGHLLDADEQHWLVRELIDRVGRG